MWRSSAERLAEAMARAGTPERALMFLQAHLVREFRRAGVDPLVGEAVKALMPWHPEDLVSTRRGEAYLREQQARTELKRVNRELKQLRTQLTALEERRAALLSELAEQ